MGVRVHCQFPTGKEMRHRRKRWEEGQGSAESPGIAGWERTLGRVSQILKEQLKMIRIHLSPCLAKMGNIMFIPSQSLGTLALL